MTEREYCKKYFGIILIISFEDDRLECFNFKKKYYSRN